LLLSNRFAATAAVIIIAVVVGGSFPLLPLVTVFHRGGTRTLPAPAATTSAAITDEG
jgi:hypothetical protein